VSSAVAYRYRAGVLLVCIAVFCVVCLVARSRCGFGGGVVGGGEDDDEGDDEDDGSGGGGGERSGKKKEKKKPRKALSPDEAALALELETKRYFGAFVAGLVFTLSLVIIMMVLLPLLPQLNTALMHGVMLLPGRSRLRVGGNDKALFPGSLSLMSLLAVVLATPVYLYVGWGF
jgi:hypothetical protein